MITLDSTCGTCEGKGKYPQGCEIVPMLPDLSSWDPAALRPDTELDLTQDHTVKPCRYCNGVKGPDGRSYARYRNPSDDYPQPYKSASTLKAAVTSGKARVCHRCRGLGVMAWLPVIRACYTCSGRGTRPTWNPDIDPVLPPEVSGNESPTQEFLNGWLRTATVLVVRENRGATWNELHLGLGSLYSLTDYGESWASSDEQVLAGVVESLRKSPPSFNKLTDRDTRRMGNLLLIRVTRMGCVPTIGDIKQVQPLLPPTYTEVLLNRIVGGGSL